ncbi:TPA: hypothetical protein HA239_05605 [Candidatus Woesearchaeota archaeon]|nr:hypothetical protein QT06_C0001G1247 [archaeon GW2011_AR15]MBS3104288.1 hypothetical protein [Candidatus Woesearchaeota archaeon]HIH41854.1 hypothetical protein [Candidatus Woesearchaeota archaeon]
MRYIDYTIDVGGLEKRIGVLGENHIYNDKDVMFASQIMPSYDILLREGNNNAESSLLFRLVAFMSLPLYLAYSFASDRSFLNPSVKDIAEELGKEIRWLDYDMAKSYPIINQAMIFLVSTMSIFRAPFIYKDIKTNGDTLTPGTKNYEKYMFGQMKGYNNFFEKLDLFKSNVYGRDSYYYGQLSSLLKEDANNILVSVGDAHYLGIISRLNNEYEILKINQFMVF